MRLKAVGRRQKAVSTRQKAEGSKRSNDNCNELKRA